MARTLRVASFVAPALGAALWLAAPLARAEATVGDLEDDPSLEGPATPAAPNRVAGALRVDAALGVAVPSGNLASQRPFRQFATEGPSLGGAVELGLSRSFAAAAFGAYELYGAPSGCPDCTSTGLVAGLGLVYHLAQGIAVDPWVRYGMAYRSAAVSVPTERAIDLLDGPTTATFHSFDYVSVALGADFFPVPTVGLGLFAGLDVGRSLSRPTPDPGPGTHTLWTFGVRVAWAPGQAALASEKRVGVRTAR
jgi:hypothetical protein